MVLKVLVCYRHILPQEQLLDMLEKGLTWAVVANTQTG